MKASPPPSPRRKSPAAREAISPEQAMALLQAQARPDQLAGMARFGMNPERRLGVSVPVLRALGKRLGRDHERAQALWNTGVPDAQILAAFTAEPARFTPEQMDAWTQGMAAWDVCDQACTNAFAPNAALAWGRVPVWAQAPEEFVRRAAFSLLAALAVHDKAAPDERFAQALAWVETAADDERNFVKKSVNWALRQIGKRNAALLPLALASAQRLRQRPSRAARWVAADALRELLPRLDAGG